jgi:hypothetical protein
MQRLDKPSKKGLKYRNEFNCSNEFKNDSEIVFNRLNDLLFKNFIKLKYFAEILKLL